MKQEHSPKIILTALAEDTIKGLHVRVNCVKEFELHGHDYFEFEYILKGNGCCMINNKEHILTEGDVLFINPMDLHDLKSDGEVTTVTVHFNISNIDPNFVDIVNASSCVMKATDKMRECFLNLVDEKNKKSELRYLAYRNLIERRVIATVWGDNCPEGNNYSALLDLQLYVEHGFSETVDKEKWYERFAFCGKCDPLAFEALRLFDEPCGVTEPDTIANYNFSKYLLWQDPMLGLFDANVSELNMNEHYSKLAETLKKYADENVEYKKFFEFYTAAAEALAAKSEIGIRLHKAYLSGKDLEKVKSEVLDAIDAVKKLRETHREFWFTVNNSIGWEILDMRYGALINRLETTVWRIDDYLSGKIPNIPELEEKQLYYNGDKNMPQELEYPRIVSACHMEIIR